MHLIGHREGIDNNQRLIGCSCGLFDLIESACQKWARQIEQQNINIVWLQCQLHAFGQKIIRIDNIPCQIDRIGDHRMPRNLRGQPVLNGLRKCRRVAPCQRQCVGENRPCGTGNAQHAAIGAPDFSFAQPVQISEVRKLGERSCARDTGAGERSVISGAISGKCCCVRPCGLSALFGCANLIYSKQLTRSAESRGRSEKLRSLAQLLYITDGGMRAFIACQIIEIVAEIDRRFIAGVDDMAESHARALRHAEQGGAHIAALRQ